MKEALQKVLDKGMSIIKAANSYGVSKSALHRKFVQYKNANDAEKETFIFQRKHGFKQVFSENEEQLLYDYLLEAERLCYSLTLNDASNLVYKFAVANKKTMPE